MMIGVGMDRRDERRAGPRAPARAAGLLALALAGALAAGCGGPKKEATPSPKSEGSVSSGVGKGEGIPGVAGLPIYPGARYMEDLSRDRTRLGTAAAGLTGMDTRVWVYYTDDGADKVIGWYAGKLGLEPAVTRFDLGRIDQRRAGERGMEAHFTLAPLGEGRQGPRLLSILDHDIQLPPGGVKPGERMQPRIVDKTTIRIVGTSVAAGRRAPGEEPAGSETHRGGGGSGGIGAPGAPP